MKIILTGLLWLLLTTTTVGATEAPNHYSFGVFPYLPPVTLEKVFQPMAEALQGVLQRPVRFYTKANFSKFSQALAAQRYDIALVQPFDYIWAHDRLGYLPLARGNQAMQVVIVTLPSSPLQKLSDLRGQVLALPPEGAAVSRLVENALRNQGIQAPADARFSHSRTHISCLQKVLNRSAAACATARSPLALYQSRFHHPLRIMYENSALPTPLFIIHPKIPAPLRQQILTEILSWNHTAIGKNLRQLARFPHLVSAADADYDEVRKLQGDWASE